jgi:hypothetical protein
MARSSWPTTLSGNLTGCGWTARDRRASAGLLLAEWRSGQLRPDPPRGVQPPQRLARSQAAHERPAPPPVCHIGVPRRVIVVGPSNART